MSEQSSIEFIKRMGMSNILDEQKELHESINHGRVECES